MTRNSTSPKLPLLLTRPRHASEAFWQSLPGAARKALNPVYSPLIDIVRIGDEPEIGPSDAAIFTSSNAVAFAPPGNGRTAYCVGCATTVCARKEGWSAVQSGETAAELIADLTENPPVQRLIHFSGVHIREDIAAALSVGGIAVERAPIYDQVLRDLTEEAQRTLSDPVLVPLFSPRTAKHFAATARETADVRAIVMSEAVGEELREIPTAAIRIAEHPTAEAMRCAIEAELRCLSVG